MWRQYFFTFLLLSSAFSCENGIGETHLFNVSMTDKFLPLFLLDVLIWTEKFFILQKTIQFICNPPPTQPHHHLSISPRKLSLSVPIPNLSKHISLSWNYQLVREQVVQQRIFLYTEEIHANYHDLDERSWWVYRQKFILILWFFNSFWSWSLNNLLKIYQNNSLPSSMLLKKLTFAIIYSSSGGVIITHRISAYLTITSGIVASSSSSAK